MKKLSAYLAVLFLAIPIACIAQETVKLLPPDTSGGVPLMQALKDRKSSRSFSEKTLHPQLLSNLLWAAFGVNRSDGRRTAPSAMNWQEIDIYVASHDGLFLYNAGSHSLSRISKDDIRGKTGTQSFVKDAPINLVYVADMSRVKRASGEEQTLWVGADCGLIAQNVYLYCASAGLACVVRGSIDKTSLAQAMHLRADQKIILSQTVGFPK